jgi:hypothetical protein
MELVKTGSDLGIKRVALMIRVLAGGFNSLIGLYAMRGR